MFKSEPMGPRNPLKTMSPKSVKPPMSNKHARRSVRCTASQTSEHTDRILVCVPASIVLDRREAVEFFLKVLELIGQIDDIPADFFHNLHGLADEIYLTISQDIRVDSLQDLTLACQD